MPIFFSSAPLDTPAKARSTRNAGKLLAADLREDGEEIGLAAVGDPHLLAVQHVVLPSAQRSARVLIAIASEPVCGSVRQ